VQPLASESGDWPAYAASNASTRYSPLDQINKDNVGNLRIVWRQSVTPAEVRQRVSNLTPPASSQNTPLKIGNLLYISTGLGTAAALNAATGRLVWFDDVRSESKGTRRRTLGGPQRGLAYWRDGSDERIITITGDYLVALNARTGERIATFGQQGKVDLVASFWRRGETGDLFSGMSAPVIVRDVIVVGGMRGLLGDGANEDALARREGPPGDIRGFDVRTGRLLWTFHTVPRSGELGNDTWLKESWAYTGDAQVWAPFSADEELGYVYLPTGTPTGDYWGGERHGDNLFGETLLCLDARTGKRIWHFQAVHHGLWDYDLATAPVLADITVSGRKIKAVAQVSKQGFTYVFDRVTGDPVWPIEERPVPKGDTPGEWYSPTQPFPTKPAAFLRQGVTTDDVIEWTPELRAEALALISRYRFGPLFTPPSVPGGPDGKNGTIFAPGTASALWHSQGYDPETGTLYVASSNSIQVIELVPSKHPKSNLRYVRKQVSILKGPRGLPSPFKPPYSTLAAIDLNRGDTLWTFVNGNGPRDHPAIKHLDVPPLGQGVRAGPLVTKTLVFIGEGPPHYSGMGGRMFRALDKRTGTIVWETELPGGTSGVPMTYMVDGKQYVAVTVGWSDIRAEVIALALP
jgi:quinoprotein glucose dehydrogenase